jgi:hypothetical protein
MALNVLYDDGIRASAWDLYEIREWARAFRSRGLELKDLDPRMRERVLDYLIQGDRKVAPVRTGIAFPATEQVA